MWSIVFSFNEHSGHFLLPNGGWTGTEPAPFISPYIFRPISNFPLYIWCGKTSVYSPYSAAAIISVNKHDFKPSSGPGRTLN